MGDLLIPILGLMLLGILAVEAFSLIVGRYDLILILFIISPLISNAYIVLASNDVVETESVFSYIRVLLIWFCGIAGCAYYLKTRKDAGSKLPSELKLFLCIVLIAMVSIVRSMDAYYSFIRSLSLLALLGIILGLYSWLDGGRRVSSVMDLMFHVIVLILALNVVSAVVFRDRAWLVELNARFRGFFAHPNTFGSFCMVSYPVLIWKYARSTSFRRAMIVVTFVSMLAFHILSGSRGSLITSVLIGLTWLIIKRKFKVIATAILVLAVFLSLSQDRPGSVDMFTRNVNEEGQLINLTGRDEIWSESIKLIQKSPLVGYGYEVSAQIFDSPFALYKNPKLIWLAKRKGTFHNGYITIALGLGLVGLFLWVLLIIAPMLRLVKKADEDPVPVLLAIMSSCLILNLVEYTIGPASTPASIFFWIAWALSLSLIHSCAGPLEASAEGGVGGNAQGALGA